jgi:hypothetical protein
MRQHRQVFVHLGQSKGGSTSIQSFLLQNESDLQNRSVLNPSAAKVGFNDLGLGAYMGHPKALDEYIRSRELSSDAVDNFDAYFDAQLLQEIDDKNLLKVVFSYEGLLNKSQAQVEKLLRLLRKISDDVRIFTVLRRHDRWAISSYNTRLVIQGTSAKQMLRKDNGRPHGLHYAKKLRIWLELLGADSLTTVAFEDHADILVPFKRFLGVEEITTAAIRQNLGLSAYGQEVVRMYNEMRIRQGIDTQDQLEMRRLLKSVLPRGKAMRPSAAEVALHLEHFRGDYEQLSGRFLPPDSKFFADQKAFPPQADSIALTEDELDCWLIKAAKDGPTMVPRLQLAEFHKYGKNPVPEAAPDHVKK